MARLAHFISAGLLLASGVRASNANVVQAWFNSSDHQGINASQLDWSPCKTDSGTAIECASITVPLDWANPRVNESITVAVARGRCKKGCSRIGTIMYNPGGPGVGVIKDMDRVFSKNLRRHFDIVAMDPRGVGKSTPLDCHGRKFIMPKGFPTTDAEYEALVKHNREAANRCYSDAGDLVKHIDTRSVAHDLEAVRLLLGDGKLNFIGWSYGSQLAAEYLELFPSNIRAMVLDGIEDHSVNPLKQLERQLVAYQKAFDRFATWCDSNSTCELHGSDVHLLLNEALDVAGENATCISDYMTSMLLDGEYEQLAVMLAKVLGRRSRFVRAVDWLSNTLDARSKSDRPQWSNNNASLATMCSSHSIANAILPMALIIIHCLDSPLISPNLTEYTQKQEFLNTNTPSLRNEGVHKEAAAMCTGWPFPIPNPPHRLNLSTEIPPVLVVSSPYDLKTPYDGAVNVQSQIPGSVLLTGRTKGHCSYHPKPGASEASRIMEDYLVSLKMPAVGTVVES